MGKIIQNIANLVTDSARALGITNTTFLEYLGVVIAIILIILWFSYGQEGFLRKDKSDNSDKDK